MPELTLPLTFEILGATANLIYIILLVREKILCWSFGIIGSLLSVLLFWHARLYAEALLYFFYAAMAIWGWLRWQQRFALNANPIITWTVTGHIFAITVAGVVAAGAGMFLLHNTNAARPIFDAFTTSFSFLATYMQVTKVLEGWIYWLILNIASVWLYHDRALDIYAAQIAVYALLSIWGFISWLRAYRNQLPPVSPRQNLTAQA